MSSLSSPLTHAPTVMLRSLDSRPSTHVSEHYIVVVVDASRGADILDRILGLVQELTTEPLPLLHPDDQGRHDITITDDLDGRLPPGAALTPREREVVRLVVDGYSNKMIAESLVITERTAETHVRNIREKLDFSSRTQVAAWGMRQRLLGKV
jgi:DNA-binding NarL/FixJ family response regulator